VCYPGFQFQSDQIRTEITLFAIFPIHPHKTGINQVLIQTFSLIIIHRTYNAPVFVGVNLINFDRLFKDLAAGELFCPDSEVLF